MEFFCVNLFYNFPFPAFPGASLFHWLEGTFDAIIKARKMIPCSKMKILQTSALRFLSKPGLRSACKAFACTKSHLYQVASLRGRLSCDISQFLAFIIGRGMDKFCPCLFLFSLLFLTSCCVPFCNTRQWGDSSQQLLHPS